MDRVLQIYSYLMNISNNRIHTSYLEAITSFTYKTTLIVLYEG